jgi:hypothetical protein
MSFEFLGLVGAPSFAVFAKGGDFLTFTQHSQLFWSLDPTG